jgi:hypothetical protein
VTTDIFLIKNIKYGIKGGKKMPDKFKKLIIELPIKDYQKLSRKNRVIIPPQGVQTKVSKWVR